MMHVLKSLLPRLGRAPRVLRVAGAALALLVAVIVLLLGAVAAAAVLLFSSLRRMGPQGPRPAARQMPNSGGNGPAARRRHAHDVVDVEYRETAGSGRL